RRRFPAAGEAGTEEELSRGEARSVQRSLLLAVGALLAAIVAGAFLLLPIVAIFAHTTPTHLFDQLSNPVATDAFVLSLKTSGAAQLLILLFGTPTAYLISSRRFKGRWLAITFVELPFVLPPAVAGIGLLAAFGRFGLLGSTLSFLGITLGFTQ